VQLVKPIRITLLATIRSTTVRHLLVPGKKYSTYQIREYWEIQSVTLDRSSKQGQTPLTLAANKGHQMVVKLRQARHSQNIR